MLFSISAYLGLDAFAGPGFQKMVGAISLLLALPVVTYSALDYWRAAWTSLRQRLLNIDVPIAAGIAAIFAQSVYEVVSGRGSGLLRFAVRADFLPARAGGCFSRKPTIGWRLTGITNRFSRCRSPGFRVGPTCGSARDARHARRLPNEETVSLAQLHVGDRLIIRNGELIPADARLVSGPALIDYSFVTGESEPVGKKPEDYLYAGGRQMGGAIEVETVKAVSQSYLTSLWNQDAFRKGKTGALNRSPTHTASGLPSW